MKTLLFFLTILFFIPTPAQAKIKRVKIKDDKTTHFTYEKDSSDLKHKENKLILREMYAFYKALQDDNYENYVSHLSPKTIALIPEEKLKRKFGKFKKQAVRLINTIGVRYIRKYTGESNERTQIYSVVIKLPEGQSIPRRMGFDTLKRAKFEDVNLHAGLYMIKHKGSYKIVILF